MRVATRLMPTMCLNGVTSTYAVEQNRLTVLNIRRLCSTAVQTDGDRCMTCKTHSKPWISCQIHLLL